jgi:hypothetical protein
MAHEQSHSLEKREILNLIGYRDAETISARVGSLVDDYLDNYHDFLAPSFRYEFRDIKKVTRGEARIGGVKLRSAVLARLLERSERVAVFALTIGGYLEELVAYLSEKGLVLQATVLDAVGSGAAETLAAEVQSEIARWADRRGLVISRRFSPGYCDWDVAQQGELFRLLGGNVTGISLQDSMLMVPRKSISGVIGIGLPDHGIEEYNPCTTCRKKDCPGRRR